VIVVADASVALKWFLKQRDDEADVEQAMALLAQAANGEVDLRQPPHFAAEVAAVLARLKPDQAERDLQDLLEIEHRIVESMDVYATALDLAVRHGQHVFDTLYHAIALNADRAQLVTADQRYYDKVRSAGCICLLKDWAGPPAGVAAGRR